MSAHGLAFCPSSAVKRYKKAAQAAGRGSLISAIKLKCLDCCGWEYPAARDCGIRTCALWLANRRIFGSTLQAMPENGIPGPEVSPNESEVG